MDDDMIELRNELDVLNERISILEKRDSRRRSFIYLKVLFKLILIGAIVFGIWRGYEYVVHEIPNMMEDKIKSLNPFKK